MWASEFLATIGENQTVSALAAIVTLTGGSAIGMSRWAFSLRKDLQRRKMRNIDLAEQNEELSRRIAEMSGTIKNQEIEIEDESVFLERLLRSFPSEQDERHRYMHALHEAYLILPPTRDDDQLDRAREFLLSSCEALAWSCHTDQSYRKCANGMIAQRLLDRCLRGTRPELESWHLEMTREDALDNFEFAKTLYETYSDLDDVVDAAVASVCFLQNESAILPTNEDHKAASEWAGARLNEFIENSERDPENNPVWMYRFPNSFAFWLLGVKDNLNFDAPDHWLHSPSAIRNLVGSVRLHWFLSNSLGQFLDEVRYSNEGGFVLPDYEFRSNGGSH
ncbi:hypothetical protein SAMN06297251_10147 [Fulvimarina manganoxydans]|uniref:Uncharacterized protein n=1 Tax=Fulvimarina manganoxydans TaxID=937218 RepID=A0A1W1Y8S0_9HYPH|nr:hypothetical protein [Fulvimarina manganoxydans]SMC32557.1 hypothetical protein SAMN06297251_10147 [Fulvimarina manganoxydans]